MPTVRALAPALAALPLTVVAPAEGPREPRTERLADTVVAVQVPASVTGSGVPWAEHRTPTALIEDLGGTPAMRLNRLQTLAPPAPDLRIEVHQLTQILAWPAAPAANAGAAAGVPPDTGGTRRRPEPAERDRPNAGRRR
jgi:hypothetical protein